MDKKNKTLLTVAAALVICGLAAVAAAVGISLGGSHGDFIDGRLDVTLYWSDSAEDGEWRRARDGNAEAIFDYDNWAPGHSDTCYLKIKNSGDVPFEYSISLTPDGEVGKLAEVIDVYFVSGATSGTTKADMRRVGSLAEVIGNSSGPLERLEPDGETVAALALVMRGDADNTYMGEDLGDSFSVRLEAVMAD